MENLIAYFGSFLSSNELRLNEDLKLHCSFKIGAKAKVFIQPNTKKHLKKCFDYILKHNINYHILGAGTNTLFNDEDFDGVIINLNNFKKISKFSNFVYCESGVSLFKFNEYLRNKGLTGLEYTYGIPASVGGGIAQNCGAFGHNITDCLKKVIVLTENGFKTISCKKLMFGYRNSSFKQNKKNIIIGGWFKFKKGKVNEISKIMEEIISKRRANQPYNMPSAGSVFKRCDGVIVSKLIDDLGLKGYSIGGAKVSEKHAGFIVNYNNAKSEDVKNLINFIKNKIKIEKNIDLECEIVIL